MNKPEQDFYNSIRKYLPGHVQRIENTAGSGVPDLSIAYQGLEVWVELKVATPEVLLRKEQYAWSMRRQICGGKTFVVALTGLYISVWQFPEVEVKAYGNSEKYVKIMSACYAHFLYTRKIELIKILFPLKT